MINKVEYDNIVTDDGTEYTYWNYIDDTCNDNVIPIIFQEFMMINISLYTYYDQTRHQSDHFIFWILWMWLSFFILSCKLARDVIYIG